MGPVVSGAPTLEVVPEKSMNGPSSKLSAAGYVCILAAGTVKGVEALVALRISCTTSSRTCTQLAASMHNPLVASAILDSQFLCAMVRGSCIAVSCLRLSLDRF